MKLQCPKCKTVIEVKKRLEYCICGGKYASVWDMLGLGDIIGDLDDLFKTKEEKLKEYKGRVRK